MRQFSVRRLALITAGALFLALTVGIVSLANQAFREVITLNIAKSDNLQWTLAQTEVEFLSFYNELVRIDAGLSDELPALRRWFDIFYSRINTIQSSRVYGQLTESARLIPAFETMRRFLDETAIYIDGSDADLIRAIPEIIEKAAQLRPELRSVSLEGIRVFSQLSDDRRESVADTMVRIASLTASLIVLLLLAVFWLSRLYRFGHRQTLETQQTRDRLQAMLKTSLDAVLVVDRHGKFVEFSGSASEIFGYSADEAVGQEMTKLIFPDHLIDAHNKGMQRHLETGKEKLIGAGRVQVQARRKSGEIFPVELSIAKTMSPQGEIFVSYLRDISDRLEAEQKLLAARDEALAGERAKSRFIAVMSHEMRTPLNGLLGSLDLLKTTPLSPKQAELAEMMQSSGFLLLHHVNDVLDISKLENGNIAHKVTELDLGALIDEVLESQSALAKNKGLTLEYAKGGIGTLMASAIGLRQILLNLVNNAIKFTETGCVRVEASVDVSTKMLRLLVSDTGPGISAQDQSRIFEDFVTLDSSFGRTADGTGLGLGIARRLVQALGGAITVESKLGQGARFCVEIPHVPAPQNRKRKKSAPAPSLPAQPLTPKNILVVEDNHINRFVLREMLKAAGHSVTEAHDGLAGLEIAAKQKFDVILMDISMPRLDGIAATVRLRASEGPNATIPIIALTAHALPEDRTLFLASGMNEVLTKPIDQDRIAKVLHKTTVPAPRKRANKMQKQPAEPHILNNMLDELITGLGPQKVKDLLARFSVEGDANIARIGALFDAADFPAAQNSIHSFAGSCATFGAQAMHQLLAGMEGDLKQNRAENARAALPRLGLLWAATQKDLAARVA
jgi:PAS domain S-box-containing protein